MLARSVPRVMGAVAFAVLLGAGLAAPVFAGPAPLDAVPAPLDQVSTAQLTALRAEAGLSPGQAERRLDAETQADSVVSSLSAALGRSFAGAWFEPGSTDLVVASTDPASAPQVRAAGAVPRLVALDLLTLDRVMEILDSRAGRVPDAVTGWYVDPVTNSVVVSATDRAAAEEFAAGLPAVRIEQAGQRPVPLAELHGGDGIQAGDGAQCSIGYSASSGSARYVITAGHCTELGGTWSAEDGTPIGPVAQSSFPGNDFGLIEVASPSWTQSAQVNTTNGPVVMSGTGEAPVGASVCRSGSSTGDECGTVEAVNETVNYGGGDVVQGLTRTSACASAGDSGGPFYSGSQALGILSGGAGGCFVSLFGSETYYQPVGEVLSTYDLQLVTGSG